MDSEDKLQEVMTFIKHNDLEFVSTLNQKLTFQLQQPPVVNQVLSMNRFDEMTGNVLTGDSPKKDFGVPMPGDPSVMYTL